MPGIVFLKTRELERISRFYTLEIGMKLWLDQGACRIFRKDNMLLGFCWDDSCDFQGVITFFFKKRREVDEMYQKTTAEKLSQPRENTKFRIYNFFAKDPEGRKLEFQAFLHDIEWDFDA